MIDMNKTIIFPKDIDAILFHKLVNDELVFDIDVFPVWFGSIITGESVVIVFCIYYYFILLYFIFFS